MIGLPALPDASGIVGEASDPLRIVGAFDQHGIGRLARRCTREYRKRKIRSWPEPNSSALC
jgi:hypothetical protein